MYMNDGHKTKISLSNKSVFITGVAGFIGSNLAKRLLSTVEGVKVVGLDNMNHYYTDYIQAQPGWVFVGIYADEGISGTSLEHRKGMQQLIEDCKAGKIDLVLTKSIARFARNIVDCLSVIELLKNLNLIAAKSSVWHWFA